MKTIATVFAILMLGLLSLTAWHSTADAQSRCVRACETQARDCMRMANRAEERDCRAARRRCISDCSVERRPVVNQCRRGYYRCNYNRGGRVDPSNPGCCLNVPGIPHVD